MLRQIGTLPPEAHGSFYDYLTGSTYTAIEGRLHRISAKQGRDPISLSFSSPASYATPDSYLPRLVKIQGDPVFNTQSTIVTNKTTGICVVRSSRALADRSCWQFHVPGSLHGVELGVCHLAANGARRYLNFTFNSSTSRTITFLVDGSNIKAWVNESALSKKNCKPIEWDLSECYPYVKLTVQGSTAVFNPFATEPNTKITKNNPFNITGNLEQPLTQIQPQEQEKPSQAKILDVRQLSKDKILLISQGNYIKVVHRNPENNQMEFSRFAVQGQTVWNLFTNQEWAKIVGVKEFGALAEMNWENKGYNIDQLFALLKDLIIRSDQLQHHKTHPEIPHILLSKLSILRPYTSHKIPNPISSSQLDLHQHTFSHEYFKSQSQSQSFHPLRLIPVSTVSNTAGWFKLQGSFVSATEGYVCSAKRVEGSVKEFQVFLYRVSQFWVRKVFSGVCGEQVEFGKVRGLEGYSDLETNLWKENAQTTEIYKILSNCFTSPASGDNSIYEPKEKDVTELTEIFKMSKQDAITALQQTGNIQDALAWLADPSHKQTRKKKPHADTAPQKPESSSHLNCTLLQLPRSNLTTKLLLQLENSLYIFGFDPRTFAQRYIQRTEKGFMNLSNFQYGTLLSQIDGSFVSQGLNCADMVVLDKHVLASGEDEKSIVEVYRDGKGIYLVYRGENQAVTKVELAVLEENSYKEASCFKLSSEKTELFSNQEAPKRKFGRTVRGELIVDNQLDSVEYEPFTTFVSGSQLFANYKFQESDQLVRTVDVWVQFTKNPQLQFPETEQPATPKYLPLLVEHGPPGCNLNYPICSILYPKSPLPFLANYPYSLTFRHLHSKSMKVSQIIIQRIGQKNNVNEIKEGSVYFVDEAGLKSEKYYFRFQSQKKNQLTVEVKENCYWKFMVIQPIYHGGSKMPYEIGFLGAKGVSIQTEEYERLIKNKIEESLEVEDRSGKCRFELLSIQPLSQSTYKATLQYHSQTPSPHTTITSKCPSLTPKMHTTRLQLRSMPDKEQKQDFKISKLASMSPSEIISHLTKAAGKTRDSRNGNGSGSTLALMLREIGKNQGIAVEKLQENQVKMMVDLFLSCEELSVKDFERLYDKIRAHSKPGSKYLDTLLEDIGKGHLPIPPTHLQPLLTKTLTPQSIPLSEHILSDLLSQIPILKNSHYKILQKQHASPYLMLQTDYYSKFYYNQIQGLQASHDGLECQGIFKEEAVRGIRFVVVKENKYRKYFVKFQEKCSIKHLVLRFDKSETQNKAIITVHIPNSTPQTHTHTRTLMHEHQWLQVTKNPYRPEMAAMFGSNHSWLNAYGLQLKDRVQVSYLEIEVMFNTSGICGKESNSNMIEIMPEVYGYSVGPAQPIAYLQQTYFKVSQQQKIFLSKIPQKLQIQSSEQKSTQIFNKYLINKQNIEYQLYENSQRTTSQSKLERDQQDVQFINDVRYFTRLNQDLGTEAEGKGKKGEEYAGLLERYHRVMRGLGEGGSHVKFSRKMSLDYCYTVIMWILDIYAKKGIAVSQKMGQKLLDTIIKTQTGPIAFTTLKSLSRHPSLLLESLHYIKITSSDPSDQTPPPPNSISSSFIRSNTEIPITQKVLKKIVDTNDRDLADSLLNIIVDTKMPSQESLLHAIQLGRLAGRHEKVVRYILRNQEQGKKEEKKEEKKDEKKEEEKPKPRYIFTDPIHKTLYRHILHYIFTIPAQLRNTQFLPHLNPSQLESLILEIRRLNHNKTIPQINADSNQLLNLLFANKKIQSISLDIVSLIFELGLGVDEKWDYLERCIKLCPTAEDMIHCQYLSASRDQRDQLIQLIVFHRDILLSAAKSEKNSELLANFLSEVYHCSRKLFVDVIMSLPEGQGEVYPFHSDIYSLIIAILDQNCNLGGIQGTKLCTLQQSLWLACTVKLFKLSTPKPHPQTLSTPQTDTLLRWYLQNNDHEPLPTNPITRSQSITHIKLLAEYTNSLIKHIEGAKNINKIFKIYTEIKEDVKRDGKRLAEGKAGVLGRLENGVFRLVQGSVDVGNLRGVLVGEGEGVGLAEEIIAQLREQQKNSTKQPKKPQKQLQLTQQIQAYSLQGLNLTNLHCKDLQSHKTGTKSILTKISASSKKLYLKSPHLLNMHKFVIGFNVQDTPDKNSILPDGVQLFGGRVEEGDVNGEGELTGVPSGMRKIGDLEAVEDQSFWQFGVKLFAVNFDCLRRQYRNGSFNVLQLRMRTNVQPSASDILQNPQKSLKNAVYNISFITITGHKAPSPSPSSPQPSPTYSSIYMKMLTFLSNPQYREALHAFIAHIDKKKGMMKELVELLSAKMEGRGQEDLERLLVEFGRAGVPVLGFLLKEDRVNQGLVNKILKANLSTANIDLVLDNLLAHPLTEQNLSNLTQNIKLASFQPHPQPSKTSSPQILQICQTYSTNLSSPESPTHRDQARLLRKLLACITTTPQIFSFNAVELIERLAAKGNGTVYYPVIAAFVGSGNQGLDWFLGTGKVDEVSERLLVHMEVYKRDKSKKVEQEISNGICLLSALSVYLPIRQRLISNPDNPQISRLPLKIFKLLTNEQSLIEQYPIPILKKFLNFFQSTCTALTSQQSACSQQFAAKLIEVMVRLPQVSSVYHNYFIHQFFFHIINAHHGVLVNFVWKGPGAKGDGRDKGEYYGRPTEVLRKLPIRKNQGVKEYQGEFYRLAASTEEINGKGKRLLVFNDKIVAVKGGDEWKLVQPEPVDHQIKQISHQKTLTLTLKSSTTKELTLPSTQPQKIYIPDATLIPEHQKLLTNQTLLRIQKPTIFPNKYHSTLPITLGMLPYVHLLPAEMTIQDMLKEVNICGYLLQAETRAGLGVRIYGGDKVQLEEKLADVYTKVSEVKPMIQLEIDTHDLFKNTTIEKIAAQSPQAANTPKFIAQQTIFKSFQKQKGLQKMIKVIMACVKNWGNQDQAKIWSQYLSELSSFSCFPIFSSIYMNKQENVQLLFNLLSGLPDKEENKKWLDEEKKSVRFLYDIIKNVFEVEGEQAIIVRNYAVQSGFYETMLERLHIITKENKRVKGTEADEEDEEISAPTEVIKKTSEEEYKKEIKKKKGIGYGNDSSSNQKWDIAGHEASKKELSDQIIGLIKILEKFLSYPKFKLPSHFLESTYTSAILPILESSLRGGSLLQISKNAQLFKEQLRFIRTLSKNESLIPALMQIPKCYEPKQLESIFSLLTTLEGISKIFINCLTGSVSEKTSEEIAKDIIETYNQVQESIEHYKSDHVDEEADKKILELPLTKKYPILMKDLRFDYIDMKDKNGKMKHHYNSSYQAKHTAPSTKTIRLAQELADISQALPIEHTNAIFVRCDKDRVDFMQALIMGSNGTPYGHGAYLFDIYFDDSYPNNPPKVNLTTTGSGAIRFNPNLYACGKVCLSLLGTWRGSAMENWDPKVSTLLQVLVSIQSIIMAEEIYFNEPGFEHEQGTVQGEKKNEAYSNIVRYGNIKFAMIENIKNPPKGFQTVIRRHFYLKKDQILQQCKKWLKFAQKREASYTGLVNDHNNNWSNTFKKSKTEYKTMLEKAINQLESQLNKLPEPSAKDLVKEARVKKEKKEKKEVKAADKDENLEEIDVTYDTKNVDQNKKLKEMDINDEKVKDRWSRYIGAMGLDAVSKQSKANIFMFGISSLGIEIAKNIVLSGCKRFTVCDDQNTEWKDLSGQFYLNQDDIGKNRVESCLYKLQDLNNYVRVDSAKVDLTKLEEENTLKQYHVVITTVHNEDELILLNNYCRKNGIKFIAVKAEGPYGFVFNDFGEKFEVLDKNGEDPVECFVESITNEEKGVVTLMKGQKHPYEDGDEVKITKVKGMDSKTQEGKSINDTIHKISVINQSSFKIGDTTGYTEYAGNGLVKNMKVASRIDFKPLEQCLSAQSIDVNLAFYDFAKSVNNDTLYKCFRALSVFRTQHKGQSPRPWNWQDAQKFYQLYEKLAKPQNAEQQPEITDSQKSYIYKFSFTCSGSFAPLAAFYGGLIAQQAFKAITSKYTPISQVFLTDFTEVIEDLPKEFSEWKEHVATRKKDYQAQNDRFEGLRCIVGDQVLEKVRECRVFVIGSGAIGCELLKNYAMVNLATSQKPGKGTIVVTDPDHIEISNLNRQFLFRQKHLQKPKSATAAAVVKQMNKYLKAQNKIRAKLIKVCQATKDTFSNEFFQSMDIVTNALDNVQARQYVDLRCVESKVALLESGTLSTKGHVQVIIPYKTETYGSMADPAEEGDIPHCTLKMFPEETLHCVEWARDLFGRTFTMKPKALMKILEGLETYNPMESDASVLKDSLEMLREKPTNFDDAVYVATKEFYKFYRNDIKQLLYTYPLDAKTKDGKDFWKLPKRPPTPIEQLSEDVKLYGEFISSYAVLLCKIFNVPYPKDFRTEQRRAQILKQASKIKVDPFVPSDKVAKEMATEVEQNKQKKKEQMEEQIKEKEESGASEGYVELFKQIKSIIAEEKQQGNIVKVSAEEFEKDDDANGHIDLIYSMANLRAMNYKLDPMDWITTKLKAGRITPALSTTTSCIAALQTIELIKYLKKLPVDQMKNTFINLAVPIIQAGEPGELSKIKIHEELTTDLWERWTVDEVSLAEVTVAELFKQIQDKYKIKIKTLNIAGGGPIYSDLVLGLESKKQQKEKFLKKKFKDVIAEEIAVEDLKNYIDLTLVMAVGDEFIKHVPTLRVSFKK